MNMRFKDFLGNEETLQEKLGRKSAKFVGKTLTAKVNILNINEGDISTEILGEFLSEKEVLDRFLWMKKGYKSKLIDFAGALASEDKEFEFVSDILEKLVRDRLITIK